MFESWFTPGGNLSRVNLAFLALFLLFAAACFGASRIGRLWPEEIREKATLAVRFACLALAMLFCALTILS